MVRMQRSMHTSRRASDKARLLTKFIAARSATLSGTLSAFGSWSACTKGRIPIGKLCWRMTAVHSKRDITRVTPRAAARGRVLPLVARTDRSHNDGKGSVHFQPACPRAFLGNPSGISCAHGIALFILFGTQATRPMTPEVRRSHAGSTVRYLGIEVDDALEMAEQTEVDRS